MTSNSLSKEKVRVLVVDDSALMRQILLNILSEDSEIEVVGTATDPFVARQKVKQLNPDVMTLDINMPHMDGLSFLEKIMMLRPMPVVMISTLTEKGSSETIEALQLGAVDYIAKPTSDISVNFQVMAKEICTKIKIASKANMKRRHGSSSITSFDTATSSELVSPLQTKAYMPKIVGIGASTGGVEALTEVFLHLSKTCPPIVVVQHMPPKFTASFAERLHQICLPDICEASQGQVLEAGHIYIAPGDKHLLVKKNIKGMYIDLQDTVPISGHKPSVDMLFESLSDMSPKKTMGIILTGMGKDGALGLKKLREQGGATYGQNEESCLIFGMPKIAFEMGGVDALLPLKKIASIIMGNSA